MTTRITVRNANTGNVPVDIDELFELRRVGDPPPTTVSQRYDGTSVSDLFVNVSAGAPLGWLTGYRQNGVDFSNLFAAKGTVKILGPDMTRWAGTYVLNTYIEYSGLVPVTTWMGAWYESITMSQIVVRAEMWLLPNGRLSARSSYNGITIDGGSAGSQYTTLLGNWFIGNIDNVTNYEYRVKSSAVVSISPNASSNYTLSNAGTTWSTLVTGSPGTMVAYAEVLSGTGSTVSVGQPHTLLATIVVEVRRKGVPGSVVEIVIQNIDVTASP